MFSSNWLFDFKRTLTSKSTIIIALAIFAFLAPPAFLTVVGDKAYLAGNGNSSTLVGGTVASNVIAGTSLNLVGAGAIAVSVLTILAAIVSFGNDKSRGILDSILAQPITRSGLVLSRYFSTFCALSIAASASVIAIDVLLDYLVGEFLSLSFAVGLIISFSFEIAVLLAFTFAIFYVIKSHGVMIALGVGLFSFFLLIGQVLSEYLPGSADITNTYIRLLIDSYFLNPTQFAYLVYTYTTKWFWENSIINPSIYGVTIFSLTVDSLLWLSVPLGILFVLTKRKDLD